MVEDNNSISRKHGALSEGEDSDFDDVLYLKACLNQLDETEVEVIREIKDEDNDQQKQPKIDAAPSSNDLAEEDNTPSKKRGAPRVSPKAQINITEWS